MKIFFPSNTILTFKIQGFNMLLFLSPFKNLGKYCLKYKFICKIFLAKINLKIKRKLLVMSILKIKTLVLVEILS
jgi:hypothetical protein